MNNIFNLKRFSRLFIKHTAEHYKNYLMSLTVLIGILVLSGSFLVYMIKIPIDKGFQTAMFLSTLLLAGSFFTSSVFADIGDKKKAVAALTLPASHFEKYLVAWLYSFLLFLVIYTCVFYLVILVAISVQHYPGHPAELFNIFDRNNIEIYMVYAFLHSVAFCGSIFFEKLHFIKTAFAFFIFIGILIITNKIMLDTLLGKDVELNMPFGSLRFEDNGHISNIVIKQVPEPYMIVLAMVLALIFWVAAYYRLKEKQV
jgi:hypothetical protein